MTTSTEDGGPAAAVVPRTWKMALPPGWVRLLLDERVQEAVVMLAARKTSDLPPDRREGARAVLVHELTDAVRAARDAGGIELLLSVDPLLGVVVPASCMISVVPTDGQDAAAGPGLIDALSRGGSAEPVELAGGPAVRRTHVHLPTRSDSARPAVVTERSYWLPVPGDPSFLVLNFVAPVPELAEAQLGLFEAMAETFWWVA